MRTLYVTEQGAVLRRRGELLVVEREGRELARVPLLRLEQVVLFGNVQVTTPVLATLLERDIDLVLLTQEGRYRGRVIGAGSRNAELRLRQLEAAREPRTRLRLARAFAEGKLLNQRAVLARLAPLLPLSVAEQALRSLDDALLRLLRAQGIPGVLAAEGYASGVYFSAFRALFGERFGFSGRQRRPPPDLVNALFSFGYTLLTQLGIHAVQAAGLDPHVGYLHSVHYGRPALALDLIEEFRPVVVDALVAKLLSSGAIGLDDVDRGRAEPGIWLSADARRRFLAAWEAHLKQELVDEQTRARVTLRECLDRQARRVAAVLMRRQPSYRPHRLEVEDADRAVL